MRNNKLLIFSSFLFLFMPVRVFAFDPLGALPEPGGYTSYVRIVLILVFLLPWFAFCQWVDKDLKTLRRLNREMWNGIVLGGGAFAIATMLLLPWNTTGLFVAGFFLWLIITIAVCSVYVVIRNGYVEASARVFTPAHIKSWLSSMGKKKGGGMDMVERVRLNDNAGEKIPIPTDPDQIEAYESAQNLLFDALWRRATDVELLVASSASKLTYLIDGVSSTQGDLLGRDEAEQALHYIKTIAGLDMEERRRPQEGRLRCAIQGITKGMTEVEIRTSGTTQHEKLSLRIVGAENRLRLGDLGMTEKQQESVNDLVGGPKGLIVVCAPRRNGMTTTLYALLREHDAFMQNLLTLEMQPLMDLENITQHVYDTKKHEASYARQLQTVLRREPDVVMVSDCADRETAHLSVKSAAAKKIYAGIQAIDSFDGLKKLVSLTGDMDAVADSLLAIISQRLVRKLCIGCRQAYRPDHQLLKKANLPVDKIENFYRPPPEGLVDSKGNPVLCENCQGGGYFGRVGVFEVLLVSEDIRESIRKGQPVNAIRAQARKNGMLYLQEVGLQKVIEGITSMNEVLRALRSA